MKRIGRFFLRLGLRARLMLVIGILAFVLTAGSIAAFSYAIEFTEDHLVSENQYYSLRGYIDSDIAHGKAPRLLPNKKLYADPSVVNGVKLNPFRPNFRISLTGTPSTKTIIRRIMSSGCSVTV